MLLEIIRGQLVPELYYVWQGDFMLECGRIENIYKKKTLKSNLQIISLDKFLLECTFLLLFSKKCF